MRVLGATGNRCGFARSLTCHTTFVWFSQVCDIGLHIIFYRARHYSAKRGLAIACRLSVRLSIRLSVTLVDQDHMG